MTQRPLSAILALFVYNANSGRTATAFSDQITKMGVCENQETLQLRCAMRPSDCNPTHINGQKNVQGEKYLNVNQQLLQNKGSGCACEDTPTHLCLTPQKDDPSQFVKTCVSDIFACDVNNGSLLGASEDADKHCTCAHVLDGEQGGDTAVAPTVYGACKSTINDDDYFCAFQPSDCETSYVWVLPQDTQEVVGTQCTCDKVRTGACVGGFVLPGLSGTVCSVSAEACYDGRHSVFFAPISLKQKHGESCRLCNAMDTSVKVAPDAVDATERQNELWPILLIGSLGAIFFLLFLRYCICKAKRSKDTMKGDQVEDSDGLAVETIDDMGQRTDEYDAEPTLKEIM